jgi:tRNA (pseudouridine54-N1)-methyltransferase
VRGGDTSGDCACEVEIVMVLLSLVHLHLRGFLWEADKHAVAASVEELLPDMTVQRVLLLLDRRARNTGTAVVSLGGDQSDAPALAAALDGRKISYFERYGAARYLEVRPSTTAELQTLRNAKAKILRGSRRLAPQAYLGGAAAALEPPGLRDFVVNVNGAAEEVAAGRFALNDLPRGRVDLLARCAAAALFLSHGVRKRSRVWLHLDGHGRTVCFDGGRARGLRPDEVCLASALRTALRGGGDGVGVSVHDDASLEARLAALQAEDDRALLVLHEEGPPLHSVLQGAAPEEGAVLVLGGSAGFSADDEATLERLGGLTASVGRLPLLASHCIVLAHAALDQAVG